jgi:hypothetical protein
MDFLGSKIKLLHYPSKGSLAWWAFSGKPIGENYYPLLLDI